MAELLPDKKLWKRGRGAPKKKNATNFELMADLSGLSGLRGLLSGGAVWIPTELHQLEHLEALVLGMLDGGINAGDSVHAALFPEEQNRRGGAGPSTDEAAAPPAKEKRIGSLASEGGRFLVRCGAEEAMFLTHALRCLQVFKGGDDLLVSPPADREEERRASGSTASDPPAIQTLTTDALFSEFERLSPRFRDRYLAFFHFRSKGWMIRSGVQFGCDFVLYQAHPSRIHSTFSVLVVPAEVRAAAVSGGTSAAEKVGEKRSREGEEAAGPSTSSVTLLPAFDWCEVRAVARVCTQVSKRLLMTYVAVLPAEDAEKGGARGAYERSTYDHRDAEQQGRGQVEDLVDRAFVEEITVARWNPARNRD